MEQFLPAFNDLIKFIDHNLIAEIDFNLKEILNYESCKWDIFEQ